ILHTREIPAPRFLKWRKTAERVEVTAGTGVNVRTPRALLKSAVNRVAVEAPARSEVNARPAQATNDQFLAPPPPLLPSASRSGELAERAGAAYAASGWNGPRMAVASTSPAVSHKPPLPAPAAPAAGSAPNEQQSAIARQLNSIQQMVAKLTRESLQKVEEI